MHFIITNEIITIIIRLSLIVLLSGIIGFERQLKNHPAGLRTHILVGVGSCLLMLMSLYGFESYLTLHPQVTRYDPSRIPSYVISGIGFLGAGSIIIYGGVTVKGLTTAANIWTVAGLGLVVGVGMYFFLSHDILWLFLKFKAKSIGNKFRSLFILANWGIATCLSS